jgi:hypothetical protein
MNQVSSRRNYFLSYATANEQPMYWDDFANCVSFAKHDPGVDLVQMFIGISEVYPRTVGDENVARELVQMIERNSHIKVRALTFKSNIGRDFSSHAHNLRKIAKEAKPEDFILFLNRSAHGPFNPGWFSTYITQYQKFPNVALCGSTIDFNVYGPPSRMGITHVISFAMLSQYRHFEALKDNFPGEHEQHRDGVVANGEIALNNYMLNQGKSLTCLAWPDYAFNSEFPRHPHLPAKYLELEIRDQPFRFKLWDNPHRWTMLGRAKWCWRVVGCRGVMGMLQLYANEARMRLSRKAHVMLSAWSNHRKSGQRPRKG